MNVMFLLIPALLLAMETATMAAIAVSTPNFVSGAERGAPTTAPDLQFKLAVRDDGFVAEVNGERLDRLPLAGGLHDYGALDRLTAQLHARFATASRVEISAENEIDLATLVTTMETLRGPSCTWTRALAPS